MQWKAVFLVEIGKVHQEDLVCFEALNTLLLALLQVVKPHKGRLFGLGKSQMENYDHIAPPAVVLTRQAQLEKEVINLTRMVKLMSHQLNSLCEARGVPASDATINPSPSSPPTPNEQRI
uniref:Uncharacterized protein n=1 Tax=Brassica campestris TaxID=3711 RepID=M4DE26_BRACM